MVSQVDSFEWGGTTAYTSGRSAPFPRSFRPSNLTGRIDRKPFWQPNSWSLISPSHRLSNSQTRQFGRLDSWQTIQLARIIVRKFGVNNHVLW